MKPVLLTVSGMIPAGLEDQIRRGERPLTDYVALAHGLEADLLDYNAAHEMGGAWGRLLERVGGPNLMLAWASFRMRDQYQVIFTDGEQVGLPLAGFLKFFASRRRPKHFMIAHILSVPKKLALLDTLRLANQIDTFFVYSTWQKEFIENRWKVAPERVVFTHFMVDAKFFAPDQVEGKGHPQPLEGEADWPVDRPVICAVGLEFRDYPTLIEAVRDLPVSVVIAAASPWSKRSDTTAGHEIPENVFVRRFNQFELRRLYAQSAFMVMPLYEVEFQAGITAILESMAMARPVICSRTSGQTDVLAEGETGLYVPPGDVRALRGAIERLLAHPDEVRRMGLNARRRVETELSLECYVARINRYVERAV